MNTEEVLHKRQFRLAQRKLRPACESGILSGYFCSTRKKKKENIICIEQKTSLLIQHILISELHRPSYIFVTFKKFLVTLASTLMFIFLVNVAVAHFVPFPIGELQMRLFCSIQETLKKRREGGRDRTPREGQALRWRSSSQDVTGCWLEDAQEGLGRPTKTALQLQGVVFQAPASPLAAAQRVLACTGPRPERQGSKARSFIYSGCC